LEEDLGVNENNMCVCVCVCVCKCVRVYMRISLDVQKSILGAY